MIRIKTIIPISNIEQATLNGAIKIFNTYKKEKIIKNSDFDSSKWLLCNDSSNVGFNYEFNKKDYKKYQELFGEDFDSFVIKVKIYILYKMGTLALNNLQGFLLSLKKMLKVSPDSISSIDDSSCIYDSEKLYELMELFKKDVNIEEIKFLKSEINNLCHINNMKRNGSQRILAAYNSYLVFMEKINQFWKECNDEEEKLFFFPIWLWWQITSIIPMRPIEFVLTPRNCLKLVKGEWQLTIRKNRIKGSKRKIKYKISEDYYTELVIITPDVAKEINWYINKTKRYAPTELETLFITETHYKRWNKSKPYNSRYFTYVNLNTCLNCFYDFILKDLYSLDIIDDKERSFLNSNEIQRISLGDTRHLAMINAIKSGVIPSVVSVLSGHDSTTMSSHYFSNADKFVECETYRAHNKLIKQKNAYDYSNRIEQKPYKNDKSCDYSNCVNAIGPNGELGHCKSCKFNPRNRKISNQIANEHRQAVKDDAMALYKIANLYRKNKVDKEDFMIAYQRYRGSENSYSEYLLEKKGELSWEEKGKLK